MNNTRLVLTNCFWHTVQSNLVLFWRVPVSSEREEVVDSWNLLAWYYWSLAHWNRRGQKLFLFVCGSHLCWWEIQIVVLLSSCWWHLVWLVVSVKRCGFFFCVKCHHCFLFLSGCDRKKWCIQLQETYCWSRIFFNTSNEEQREDEIDASRLDNFTGQHANSKPQGSEDHMDALQWIQWNLKISFCASTFFFLNWYLRSSIFGAPCVLFSFVFEFAFQALAVWQCPCQVKVAGEEEVFLIDSSHK